MKRHLFSAALITALLLTSLFAQDNPLAREESDVRFQRLNSRLDDLEVTFQRFQKDLDKLESEVRGLRDQMSRLADNSQNAATQESIKRLADAIAEVDRNRIKHQENVDSALQEMEKLLSRGGSAQPRNNGQKTPPKTQKPEVSGKGFEYTIRENDNAGKIAAALREQKGLKITSKQIVDANPGVDWTRLRIGQKIFIPDLSQP